MIKEFIFPISAILKNDTKEKRPSPDGLFSLQLFINALEQNYVYNSQNSDYCHA